MEYLLTFLYAAVFFFIISKSSFFRSASIRSCYFGYIFVLKIFAGILLGYLYKKYFNGGDTFAFFNDACKMFDVFKSDPVAFFKMLSGLSSDPVLDVYYKTMASWDNYEYYYNDSKTIIRINALIRFLSFGYYNVHVVFFSFLSLIGLTGLFKVFSYAAPEKEKELFASAFLIPSVLFWTSGILKEGIVVFALGLFLYSFVKIVTEKPVWNRFIPFAVSFIILFYIKIYILATILPGIIAYWWAVKTKNKNVFLKFLTVYVVYSILLFNLKHVNPNYNLAEIIYWKQHNTIGYALFMKSGSFAEPPYINPDIPSIIKSSPQALLNVLTLPNQNHIHNPFAAFAAFENSAIIAAILISCIFFKKPGSNQKPLIFLSFFFVIALFVIIGLTSPIIGAMVRYKTPALPFLLFIPVIIYNREKVLSFISKKS